MVQSFRLLSNLIPQSFILISSLLLPITPVQAIHKEIFTTNAVCSAKNCINPVFPGLESINVLALESYTCQELSDVQSYVNFCAGAVDYNPSLPQVEGKDVETLVKEQETKAMTQYFLHLNAMGKDGWDYTNPSMIADGCVQSVWKLVCYTYFPKTPRHCSKNEVVSYMRPCQSSCENYVSQCNVECCDESVQCSFQHDKKLGDQVVTTHGYSPHDGPSLFCTGSATKRFGGLFNGLMMGFGASLLSMMSMNDMNYKTIGIAMIFGGLMFGATPVGAVSVTSDQKINQAIISANTNSTRVNTESQSLPDLKGLNLLQQSSKAKMSTGMTVQSQAASTSGSSKSRSQSSQVPTHRVGNWRSKPDYLIEFEFLPPGGTASDAILNSCSLPSLAQTLQCNGRGVCKSFNPDDIANPVMFCQCESNFADPECRTRRKSQTTAYLLSVFLGVFGADRFYLGFPISGSLKLISFGGFGFWWLMDVVYIGSAPVYTPKYRVAANLPHWLYVASSVTIAIIVGFIVAFWTTSHSVAQKRRAAFLYHAEEETHNAMHQGGNVYPGTGMHAKKAPQPQISFPSVKG